MITFCTWSVWTSHVRSWWLQNAIHERASPGFVFKMRGFGLLVCCKERVLPDYGRRELGAQKSRASSSGSWKCARQITSRAVCSRRNRKGRDGLGRLVTRGQGRPFVGYHPPCLATASLFAATQDFEGGLSVIVLPCCHETLRCQFWPSGCQPSRQPFPFRHEP